MKKKTKYEKPEVINLGEAAGGKVCGIGCEASGGGPCIHGPSAAPSCQSGDSAEACMQGFTGRYCMTGATGGN